MCPDFVSKSNFCYLLRPLIHFIRLNTNKCLLEKPKSESENNTTDKVNLTEKEKDEIEKARPSYCKLCRTCEEETDIAEDLSYHCMNNHQPQEVLEHYRQKYIQEKRYCIRKGSPFSGWFSTPLT